MKCGVTTNTLDKGIKAGRLNSHVGPEDLGAVDLPVMEEKVELRVVLEDVAAGGQVVLGVEVAKHGKVGIRWGRKRSI